MFCTPMFDRYPHFQHAFMSPSSDYLPIDAVDKYRRGSNPSNCLNKYFYYINGICLSDVSFIQLRLRN